ncbi:Nn.00g071750.m01.CDS01 [Neocucurbitaria sp. VM-36]
MDFVRRQNGSTPLTRTPPTVPSSTSSVVAQKSRGVLSGGAVAGVAIGMLLAGLLIAGAIFFLLLRRQKKRQYAAAAYTTQHLPYNGVTRSSEKGPTIVASAMPSSIDDLLPQPAADDTITDEVSKIRDNIKNHVRTYYHSTPVSAGSINETELRDLASATGVSSPMLGSALSKPSTRQDALRLAFAWVVLSRSTGQRDASLLPVDLARLATSIVGRDDSNTTNLTLHSKWKVITGAMLQQRFGKNAQDPSRAQTFANTIEELDSVFAPFIQGNVDGGQRRKNLDMILTRAANFAFLLFSQPGSFYFDFSSGFGGLVAFPALVQTIDDQGQVSRPARVLIEKEVAV